MRTTLRKDRMIINRLINRFKSEEEYRHKKTIKPKTNRKKSSKK